MKISEKYQLVKDEINVLMEGLGAMKALVEKEDRRPTVDERDKAAGILDRVETLEAQRTALEITGSAPQREPTRPDVSINGGFSPIANRVDKKPGEFRAPGDAIDYRSLFGAKPEGHFKWADENVNFFQAVFSGRMHPLLQRAMSIDPSSDGGFLVPTEFSRQIHDVALEDQIVMPRANVVPMGSNELQLPGVEIGSHASHLFGGFVASYTPEKGTITEASPKTRQMVLNAKKLTGRVRLSNELLNDMPDKGQRIMAICSSGLAWYYDKAFLKGNGAGQPQGILNANCLLKQTKETGQAAGSITYVNIVNMLGKLNPASFKNSVWVCHQTTIPQLLQLAYAVGTGGSLVPVLSESGGKYTMLTRPVIFTEKTETLGSEGDILLADFSQYVVGLRESLRFDVSIHVHFNTDESVGRLISRHDGQCLWDEALTLEDGSSKVSPFVTLKVRA